MNIHSFIRAGGIHGQMLWRGGSLLALIVGLMVPLFALDTVDVTPQVSVAYEAGLLPGSVTITRTGSTNGLTVFISTVGSTAIASPAANADFTALPVSVNFLSGESSKTVLVTPLQDVLVEGREAVLVTVLPDPAYIVGSSPSAQISIADDDLQATLEVPDVNADEDVTLFGFPLDLEVKRRGVTRVRFSNTNVIDKNLTVRFAGAAALGSDYSLFYKVCGSNTSTGTNSIVGINTSLVTTGVGYSAVAYLAGEGTAAKPILINGTVPITASNTLTFSDDLSQTYAISTGTATGSGSITLVGGLRHNLKNNSVVSISGSVVTSVVAKVYSVGATTIDIQNGRGGIFRGDVFTLAGDPTRYVATNDVITGEGSLDFSPGLAVQVSAVPELSTLFAVGTTLVQIPVPNISRRVEFAIEPIADGAKESVESVVMTLLASEDYGISNPTVGTVQIADRDVIVDVALGSNAGKPSSNGSFIISLKDSTGASTSFPVAVTVPYAVSGTATAGTDYVALSGSVSIPAGQSSVVVAVTPRATLPTGLQTVTITLSSTLSYALAGSSSSSANPSATVNITDSLGSVSVATTTATTTEALTPIPGRFTVTLDRGVPASTGALSVSYAISGTASPSTRYSPLLGTVVIPNGSSTATIDVTPVDNQIADGSQTVVVTLVGGQGYTVSSSIFTAQVTILDDEPNISVVRLSDAARPSTPGSFRISYTGVPAGTALTRDVTVNYTFSGTAVPGVDFTNSSSVVIPANFRQTTVTISPTSATGGDVSVVLTIKPDPSYTIAGSSDSLLITQSASSSGSKPTPGSVNSSSSSSSCGAGSSFAIVLGMVFLALQTSLAGYRSKDSVGR